MNIKRKFFNFTLIAVTVFLMCNVNTAKAFSEESGGNNQDMSESRSEAVSRMRRQIFSENSLKHVLCRFLSNAEGDYEIAYISRDAEDVFSYVLRDDLRNREVEGGMCVDWLGVEQANAIEELLRRLMQLSYGEEIVSYEGARNNQMHVFKIRIESGEVVEKICPEQINCIGGQTNV